MTAAAAAAARLKPSRSRIGAALRHMPMFRTRVNAIATTVVGGYFLYLSARVFSWSVVHAIWTLPPGAGTSICRAALSLMPSLAD